MWENVESWLVYVNKIFWIAQQYFSNGIIKGSSKLYFKAMPNSIEFYRVIFLHVIPVCILVPWLEEHSVIPIEWFENNYMKMNSDIYFYLEKQLLTFIGWSR